MKKYSELHKSVEKLLNTEKEIKKIKKEQKLQGRVISGLDSRIFDNTISEFRLRKLEEKIEVLKYSGAVSTVCICVLGALVTYLLFRG